MIHFNNGEYIGGDLTRIINTNFNQLPTISCWNNPIMEDCWIFLIPEQMDEITLFNSHSKGIIFIPEEDEDYDENYEVFWDSKQTFLFASFEQALIFISNYRGPYSEDVKEFYNDVLVQREMEEVLENYRCLCDIDSNSDMNLYEELEEFLEIRGISPRTTLATIKLYMIDWYRTDLGNQRLRQQN